MRILLVSTSYPADEADWRGRFIANMVEAISRKNVEMSIWAPSEKFPSRVINRVSDKDKSWLLKMMSQGGFVHLLRQHPFKGIPAAITLFSRLRKVYRNEQYDVAHINWLQNALPLSGTGKPALITVLGSDFGMLKVPGMCWLLRQMLKNRKCIIAPNAAWMIPELQTRFGDIAEIRQIPFGIQGSWFEVSRNLPVMPRWLAVMRITKNKIGSLFEWGGSFFGKDRELHLFGPMQEETPLPEWVIWHGPASPTALIKDWLPNATGLITLSDHDEGRPQVMIEAMAAGLPIIASKIKAHEDLLEHAKTGFIVDSIASLREALRQLENPSINRSIGNAARAYAQDQIGSWDDCARRYEDAYRHLLGSP